MAGVNTTGVRVWCDFRLPAEFVVESGVNDELILTVDGVEHSIQLTPGTYMTSHDRFVSTLTEQINSQINSAGVPVEAKVGGIHDDDPRTVLVFEHTAKGDNTKSIAPTGGTVLPEIIGSVDNVIEEPARLTPGIDDLKSRITGRVESFSDLEGKTSARVASTTAFAGTIGVRLQGRSDKMAKVTVQRPPTA